MIIIQQCTSSSIFMGFNQTGAKNLAAAQLPGTVRAPCFAAICGSHWSMKWKGFSFALTTNISAVILPERVREIWQRHLGDKDFEACCDTKGERSDEMRQAFDLRLIALGVKPNRRWLNEEQTVLFAIHYWCLKIEFCVLYYSTFTAMKRQPVNGGLYTRQKAK